LEHTFFLVAPGLDNYRYRLLTVLHRTLEAYPVSVNYIPGGRGNTIEAKTQDEFVNLLGGLLGREETKRIVHSLLAQSQ
jgi:hypothetical protein